jgi:hypothetical protein
MALVGPHKVENALQIVKAELAEGVGDERERHELPGQDRDVV